MKHYERRSLEVLHLLLAAPYSYKMLADQLCISQNYAKQVVRRLRRAGLGIRSRMQGREAVFWVEPAIDGLARVLSADQYSAVQRVMLRAEPHLHAALHALTQSVLTSRC